MVTNEKKVKNIHAGHRQRLRKQIDSIGLYNLSDLHFLEYLLTFVIKRADTNPIAHGLLNKFGSMDKIFNAPLSQLTKVKGIGQKTAEFLQYMSSVVYMNNKDIFDTAKLPILTKEMNVDIAILTVPRQNAQQVADFLIKSNIKYIWNFTPAVLKVPPHVKVWNENIMGSFLQFACKDMMN